MDPVIRAATLDEVFHFIREKRKPASSYQIGTRVLRLKLRDKRQMRRAVRNLLCLDHRFQEVHAGQWETLDRSYGDASLDKAEFRVLDLEVTGSDPKKNAVIDVGVFGVHGTRVTPMLSSLVNPEIPIPSSIVRLTGITSSMVKTAPTFRDLMPQLLKVLDGGIFVAHNASFDYHFLKHWIEKESERRFTIPHICTVKLSHRLLERDAGSRKLHHLAKRFGIPLKHRHRAHDDAYATARILVELKKLMRERKLKTVGDLKLFEAGYREAHPKKNGKKVEGVVGEPRPQGA